MTRILVMMKMITPKYPISDNKFAIWTLSLVIYSHQFRNKGIEIINSEGYFIREYTQFGLE